MRSAVHIGPYRLRRAIGTDGVVEQWAATHGPTQRAVAVEILKGDPLRYALHERAFRIGVRRLAELANPSILHLYDAGEVDGMAASAANGDLVEGTPWIVTELCSGGTLDEIKRPFRWAELKAVLIALLDALAHMHSRSIIHGALRPSVVFLNGPHDERPGLKLGDFRRGHYVDGMVLKEDFDGLGDVLHSIAPEQLRRNWRDVGPTTDLYSLGCVAWQLACNRRPFRGFRGTRLVDAHLDLPLPTLQPTGPVPDGLEDWIDRLTLKDPSKRFQRAADAAWALIRLGDVEQDLPIVEADALVVALDDGPRTFVHQESGQFDLNDLRRQLEEPTGNVSFSTRPELTESELTVFQGALSPDIPPVPATWQEKDEYRWERPRGTGMGLYPLVRQPMLDRELERTLLWETFREVVQERSARLYVLNGRAGMGKTHVARWLCERAHELGAATVLKATHSRQEPPGTSVRRMFTTHLRASRLDRAGMFERVKTYLFRRGVRQIDEVECLTELLSPSRSKDAEVRKVAGVEERHAVVRRFFRLLTLERPLIVWLEDAHWGNDALGLTYSVMENQRYSPMPVLFILTARDEALAERPVERSMLAEILKLKGSAEMRIPPLPTPYQLDLLQRVLGLEESLANQICKRTSGNPQLAIEVVGDWLQRGALDPTAGGFALAPGQELVLPDDLHAVWARRVERVLTGLPEGAASFLEAAAVLGLEVDEEEWAQVTDHPQGFHFPGYLERGGKAFFPYNARVRAKLAGRLMDFRLAEETDNGWAFSHGMIRESLLRWARESGRHEQHHRAAASMLQVKIATGRRGLAERLGNHLQAAGDLEEALEPLMAGVLERKSALGVLPALALLKSCEDTMERLKLATSDVRWGRLWLARSMLEFVRGDYVESERWARQAALTASDNGWRDWGRIVQEAVFRQAQIAQKRGEYSGAEQLLRQLEASITPGEDPTLYAMAMFGLAAVARVRGNTRQALANYGEARRYFEIAQDPVAVADCWKEMGNIDLMNGEIDGAAELFRRAIVVYEGEGERHQVAICLNGLAEVSRHRGDLGEAELGYRHALQIFEATGSAQSVVARLNLALLHLRRGDFDDAHREGLLVRNRLKGTKNQMLGAAAMVLTAANAGSRSWEAYDESLAWANEAMRQVAFSNPDIAWCAHKAGDLALQSDHVERARAVYRFAYYQYRALEDADGMARMQALLGEEEL